MASLAQLSSYVATNQLVTSFDVAAAMLLVYDCILTFGMEVEFVWSSPWGFMKVLYIFQRYLPFCDSVFLSMTHLFAINIDPTACQIVVSLRAWLMILGMNASEVILTLRAWAVWKRDHRLGVSLLTLFMITIGVEVYAMGNFLRGLQFIEKPYPEFVGCFVTSSDRTVYLDWTVFMVYEAVILVLMVIPGISSYRRGGNIALHDVIYREGIMMYIYLFGLSIINLFVVIAVPGDYVTILTSMERVIHSLLTSRVLLHIREYMKRHRLSCTDALTDIQVDLNASKPEDRCWKP